MILEAFQIVKIAAWRKRALRDALRDENYLLALVIFSIRRAITAQ